MMRRAAFRLKTRLVGRDSERALREFRAADAAGPDELERLTTARSARAAQFAMQHSRFYREFYSDAGFTLADLDDPAAFTELPLLDKALVRDNFETLRSDEATARTSAVSRTGGSTGLPLHVLRDLRFPARALEWRLFDWWGIEPWDDRGIVTRHMLTGRKRLLHDLQWLPSRRVQLDAFHISDETTREFVDAWNRLRPPFLLGYGGAVLDVARRSQRLGLTIAPPRAVAVTAAPLAPGVRAEIEAAFGAPCYDHYRSAEVPWIAGECAERTGLHVFSDVRRVEILAPDLRAVPAGTEGDVVVSDLTNRVFPVLRYRLGDISSILPGTCRCGRPLPRLGVVAGRSSDAVRLPDGSTIAGALGHIFDHAPLSVRQFEIVQAHDYSIVLRCVPADGASASESISRAEATLRRATRDLVPVTLELVDDIPATGGKMRFIRSDAPVPR
ncbi:phenylacetate-CoA ligase [Sediminihabitans luteus]|uniref:Phenylacetate-CoA ligase n=1 Tax=Sediminihabitans luteus TaxID=1138585 RepID=A0A2M9CDF2_9CELL|nr:phenylacetate--CoA ligase family protein [Sediminihabitans luteus]PJJ69870.1 phenylacetate-CoA ligase [Sediminihabitans luteus]GII99189.1 capsular polysaccharide biosynthesis protein [Sediminihabitans luteus]